MLEGHLLDERYLIKETIGGGGMANVYLATDTILERDVAIKVLRLEYANDEEFIERFHREAQAATSLSHPNIVNIFDVGEEDHILYMVMEYVDGLTLKEYIQRYGPIDVEEALNIMKQVTSAIAHAHENDLVHRDIKPQNILIDTYGQVKVTDFGIAIALSATSLTKTNSILGSVHYLSPEQARGGMATKKSDIYSLGIVFFELLTGKLPFSGQSPVSIALKHLQNNPPSVRSINPSIPQSAENIVLQSMAKDPFHRYGDVTELYHALEHALDLNVMNEPPFSPPVEAGEETKAIPVITDDQLHSEHMDDTILNQTDANTIKLDSTDIEEAAPKKKKQKPKKQKKEKNKKKKWIWIALALVLIILSAVVALFVLPSLFKLKDVKIPDVTEYHEDEAVEELEALKLVVEKKYVFSEEIEEDHVIETDPKAGRTVKEESTVTLYISDGKEKLEFDNYVGDDFNQTKRILVDKGFAEDDIIAYEKDSDRPVGEILSQVQPDSGSFVIPSETRVIFEVSGGPATFQLKDLVGSTLEEAQAYADDQGVAIDVTEVHSDSVEAGLITKQDPGANANVEVGSTIHLSVSIGPEEIPPEPHTVTFSVPYTNGPSDEDEADSELEPQTVTIYIRDMNNNIEDVYEQETITEDKEYSITLTIAPGDTAEYRVERDGETIFQKEIP